MTVVKKPHENIDFYIRSVSAEVGLDIHSDYLPGVRNYLQISQQMMHFLEKIKLSIEEDPAPIFHA